MSTPNRLAGSRDGTGRGGRNPTGLLSIAVVLALVLAIWLISGGNPGTPTATGPDYVEIGADAVDPASGLAWIEPSALPPEAGEVLDLIDAGGPFPYEEDGSTFGNFEELLPDRGGGYYAEYTVDTPGLDHRGARRIVAGDDGERYWTEDHYASFTRIRIPDEG